MQNTLQSATSRCIVTAIVISSFMNLFDAALFRLAVVDVNCVSSFSMSLFD